MATGIEKIREIAAELLEKGDVKKVIGFAKGTVPMGTSPIAIQSKQGVEKLVFNSTCGLNLANYLSKEKEKIAIVAKGCDSRNIVTHIIENQINREQIFIIGVPCTGMVDKNRIIALFEDEITAFSEDGDTLTVSSQSKTQTLKKQDYLKGNCLYCTHKNPVIHDVLATDPVEEQTLENLFPDVDQIEGLEPDAKWNHFENLIKNCIRCYACRNACPLCYCPTCFVDESDPQWVGKGQDKTDVSTFHFLRAFHCAGRCTDCGACVEACPMGINVRDFTRKLNKDVLTLFGWEAGLDITKRPPLDTYRPEDPDEFIK